MQKITEFLEYEVLLREDFDFSCLGGSLLSSFHEGNSGQLFQQLLKNNQYLEIKFCPSSFAARGELIPESFEGLDLHQPVGKLLTGILRVRGDSTIEFSAADFVRVTVNDDFKDQI